MRKLGGVLIAALPPTPSDIARVMGLIKDVWPRATATDTVWSTVLASYDAIDRVATAVASAGTPENRPGAMLLTGWTSPGWSASPAPPCSRDLSPPTAPLGVVRTRSRGGS